MSPDKTVYLKADSNVVVYDRKVALGDIASITCADKAMERQLRQKKIYSFPADAPSQKMPKMQRAVFSILRIVELIHEDYPNAQIDNEGEADFIIFYESGAQEGRASAFFKTAVICILIFFGAAFTIMSFNNDIGITDLFGKFYYQVMGQKSSGMTEIEAGYCVGIAIGILVFFNHFGSRKITPDPTPIQVEMRKYEKDVNTAYIESAGRGGVEIDAG